MNHLYVGASGTASPGQGRLRFERLVFALAGLAAVFAITVGCGGKQSTASQSAAAFDDAARKGESPGAGEAHGGHGAASPPLAGSDDGMAGMDHSAMPDMGGRSPSGTKPSGMAGMDHSNMPGMNRSRTSRGASPGLAGMDHSAMPGMRRPGASTTNQSGMAGMDHSGMAGMNRGGVSGQAGSAAAGAAANTMSGMGHDMGQMGQMAAPATLPPEPPTAVAQPGQPATILRPDPLDAPVPTAIRDASRGAAMAAEMAGGGMAMSHGTYRQVDAGRDVVRVPVPMTGGGHEGHQMAPSTASPMSPGAHGGAHGQAAPGASSPAGAQPAAPASPAADPHRMHAAPSPKPKPKPSPSPSPGGNQ